MRTQRLRGEQPVTLWTAAYSQNPRLFVKLKMRQVEPLEVQLSATAFFDGPLENIENPVVEIVPASLGDKKTELSRASSNVLTRRQYYDQAAERWVTLDRTLYMGTVSVDEPGLYSVEVRFVNTGTATTSSEWCSDVADAPEAADDLVAPFVRVLSRQIKIWE